jgi:hypothetical protein
VKPKSLLLRFTLGAAVLTTACAERDAINRGPRNSTLTDKRSISLGVRKLTAQGVCGIFDASASSGDFFKQLRKENERSGPTFRLHGELVSTFPDQILVSINGPVPCSGSPLALETSRRFQEVLSFDVYWLNGGVKRPATGLTFSLVQSPFRVVGIEWVYQLQFSSREIPLTATLIVEAFTRDGQHLADFSAHL